VAEVLDEAAEGFDQVDGLGSAPEDPGLQVLPRLGPAFSPTIQQT
jgi:hypothetical protein